MLCLRFFYAANQWTKKSVVSILKRGKKNVIFLLNLNLLESTFQVTGHGWRADTCISERGGVHGLFKYRCMHVFKESSFLISAALVAGTVGSLWKSPLQLQGLFAGDLTQLSIPSCSLPPIPVCLFLLHSCAGSGVLGSEGCTGWLPPRLAELAATNMLRNV